jgi:hypothetical protein
MGKTVCLAQANCSCSAGKGKLDLISLATLYNLKLIVPFNFYAISEFVISTVGIRTSFHIYAYLIAIVFYPDGSSSTTGHNRQLDTNYTNSKHIQAKHNTQNTTIKDTTTGNIEKIQTTTTIQQQQPEQKVKHAI